MPAAPTVFMLSKAGHSIHPMLVALPIGMFVVTIATLLAFMNGGDPVYYRAAMVANVAGVAAAVIAALPGAIDLFSLPPGSSARSTGIKQSSSTLLVVGVFAMSAALLVRGWSGLADGEVLAAAVPLAVALSGMLVVVIAGALGWTVAQPDHVAVRPSLVRGHAALHRPSFHH